MITPPISTAPATETATCPECGSALTTSPRFTRWCTACRWNVVPGAAAPLPETEGRARKGFSLRLNQAAEQQLFQQLSTGPVERPGLDGKGAAAFALAGLVHLSTLALLVAGGWMVLQHGWPIQLFGLLVFVSAAILLRPRLGTLRSARKQGFALDRATAPKLYALADRTADALHTHRAELIVIDPRFNASYQRVGVRRRAVLTLGLPLWEILDPAERTALLGHEFGHGANGDVRRGLWVGGALQILRSVHDLTVPERVSDPQGLVAIAAVATRFLMAGLNGVVELLYRLLGWLTRHSQRRAEYLADAFAVRLGGTAGATGLLETLPLQSAFQAHLEHRQALLRHRAAQRVTRGGTLPEPMADFWDELRGYFASLPRTERDRRVIAAELTDRATDQAHPPVHLRLAFTRSRPVTDAAVRVTPEQSAAIDRELAPARVAMTELLD
ncbi:M48 family metallopeptidase [Streptacidiphilus sp. N1-12]|uniref:M48 family metallopeptidase n=2 Tax=Streptacidiphilus alkalitolerans TaxID=3342712 RepID=A0ABV6VHM2_9ACTN